MIHPSPVRIAAAVALVAALMSVPAASPSQATTTLPFSVGTTTYIFDAAGNGVVDFKLDLGGASVIGSFSMVFTGPGGADFGSILLIGNPSSPGTDNFGSLHGGLTTFGNLFNVSKWTLGTLDSFEWPVVAVITASFAGTDPQSFPRLTFEETGGVFVQSPVPLPAALPLFASGMGVLGWLALRRRRAQAAC